MNEERQSLLDRVKKLKIAEERLKVQIHYLEKNDAVQKYKKYTSDAKLVQQEMEEIICKIRACCHHVWYQTDFFRDKLTISNIWRLQCIACGKTTDITQNEDLDKKPYYPHIIYKDNKAGLSLEDAKMKYDEFEKQEGPEKAGELVLSLSRTPKGLK